MKNILKFMFLFVVSISNGQFKYDESLISAKVKSVVGKIVEENRLTDEFIGYAGTKSEQYTNFEQLKNASSDELLVLTNHPNGVVRCYSFWALGYKPSLDMFDLVKKHLNDYDVIEYQSGCIISREKVGDFFIFLVTPEYVDLKVNKLNEDQRKTIDSLLIYQPNELDSKYSAIENAEPTAALYPVLRDLYLSEHNQSALVKLASYKRSEDIQLILANRDFDQNKESGYFHTYRAIQNFPRPEFLPFLETKLKATLDNTHFSTEWRELYSAIVMYKNEKAVELLNIPFSQVVHENIKKYHLDFIYDAVVENYDNLYSEILWNIWERDNEITLKGYRIYLENDVKRAYKLTLTKLGGKDNQPENLPIFNYSIFTDNLEETMLNLIWLNNQELANDIIRFNLLNANVHDFPVYSSVVKRTKDARFIEPLFARFAKEWNAHVYLEIARTLITFQDEDVNKRIITTRKKNKKLRENWGGDALTELLAENNIK